MSREYRALLVKAGNDRHEQEDDEEKAMKFRGRRMSSGQRRRIALGESRTFRPGGGQHPFGGRSGTPKRLVGYGFGVSVGGPAARKPKR